MKRLYLLPNKCRGCSVCELVCSFHHVGEFNPAKARLYVVREPEAGVDTVVICRHCSKAPCMAACPYEAISRDPATNAATVNETYCTGCGKCVEACPHGAMIMAPETGLALKCDLCNGSPQCVDECPFGALIFAEQAEINAIRQSLNGEKVGKVRKKTA